MNLERIAKQYDAHMARLINRAAQAKRPVTDKERRGIEYYNRAGVAVHALITVEDVLRPKLGFVMRTAEELAPVKYSVAPKEESNG